MSCAVKKKVLITGVFGQLGSYMAEKLSAMEGLEVVGVSRRISAPPYFKKGIRIVQADISDSISNAKLIQSEKPDFFINFAGNSSVAESWNMPYLYMDSNCLAVLNQLEAIRLYAPNCRYWNAGSSEEWSASPYGISKASARKFVELYRKAYGIFAIQSYLFNAESSRRAEGFLSRKIVEGALRISADVENEEPIIVGNVDAKRDWNYAEDFLDGIWMALNEEVEVSEVEDYCFCSGKKHSVKYFIERVFAQFGQPGEWVCDGFKTYINNKVVVKISKDFIRPMEEPGYAGNNSLARKRLGWEPKHSFEGMIKKIVNDVRSRKV